MTVMPMHPDFKKIYGRFVKQYGKEKGKSFYYAWLKKKGYDDTKPFLGAAEKKEMPCKIRGFEIKEAADCFHIEGLVATTHVDNLDKQEGIDVPDRIPKETLESFAVQMNTNREARLMGVHHSEGKPFNAEFFGEADVATTPVRVISLRDGEYGLFVDTKLLKSDPETPAVIEQFQSGDLNSFSIAYDTDGFRTTDFEWADDKIVRTLNPETRMHGYTGASNPVNPNTVVTGYGFKEFKELVGTIELKEPEVKNMTDEKKEEATKTEEKVDSTKSSEADASKPTGSGEQASVGQPGGSPGDEGVELKEFRTWKANKQALEQKELVENIATKAAEGVLKKMEVKEQVLKETGAANEGTDEIALELKEFREVCIDPSKIEVKEQFRRAAAACDSLELDWQNMVTTRVNQREYKSFCIGGARGTKLEFKALGMTTNQNTDTDYLQSSAELQDIYDPTIYSAINEVTALLNLLAKDDFSKKGNNQVQFVLKTAANTSAAFYAGNSVVTGQTTRLKYQTKFKKIQVGVSVDGDMIAAARGGPVNDVFAQEVMDAAQAMAKVINAALFAEVGLETATAIIGLEYITDSAGNTSLYSLTRSADNRLAPDAVGDTYINGSSAVVSLTNLRAGKRQALKEGADLRNLVWVTSPTQADMMRGKFDDARRMLTSKNTDFGFSTDLFVDAIPIFEDVDCQTDDWFLVDLETHRLAYWVPPTIERLGKTADNEEAFIKSYLATYNRAPRRMVQIYGNATS